MMPPCQNQNRASEGVHHNMINTKNTKARFTALPEELQLKVILYLDVEDIQHVGHVSHHFRTLIRKNKSYISRMCQEQKFPFRICSHSKSTPLSRRLWLTDLGALQSRWRRSQRVASHVADFVQRARNARPRRLPIKYSQKYHDFLCSEMAPLILVLHCLKDTWRVIHARQEHFVQVCPHFSPNTSDYAGPRWAEWHIHDMMKGFCARTRTRLWDMDNLMKLAYVESVRPCSYLRIAIRWCINSKAFVDEWLANYDSGGVQHVDRVLSLKTYAARCREVDSFAKSKDPLKSVNRLQIPAEQDKPGLDLWTPYWEGLEINTPDFQYGPWCICRSMLRPLWSDLTSRFLPNGYREAGPGYPSSTMAFRFITRFLGYHYSSGQPASMELRYRPDGWVHIPGLQDGDEPGHRCSCSPFVQ